MEQLKLLLASLERISFQDISEVPEERQHEVAEQIEQLQDSLSLISQFKGKWTLSEANELIQSF